MNPTPLKPNKTKGAEKIRLPKGRPLPVDIHPSDDHGWDALMKHWQWQRENIKEAWSKDGPTSLLKALTLPCNGEILLSTEYDMVPENRFAWAIILGVLFTLFGFSATFLVKEPEVLIGSLCLLIGVPLLLGAYWIRRQNTYDIPIQFNRHTGKVTFGPCGNRHPEFTVDFSDVELCGVNFTGPGNSGYFSYFLPNYIPETLKPRFYKSQFPVAGYQRYHQEAWNVICQFMDKTQPIPRQLYFSIQNIIDYRKDIESGARPINFEEFDEVDKILYNMALSTKQYIIDRAPYVYGERQRAERFKIY